MVGQLTKHDNVISDMFSSLAQAGVGEKGGGISECKDLGQTQHEMRQGTLLKSKCSADQNPSWKPKGEVKGRAYFIVKLLALHCCDSESPKLKRELWGRGERVLDAKEIFK